MFFFTFFEVYTLYQIVQSTHVSQLASMFLQKQLHFDTFVLQKQYTFSIEFWVKSEKPRYQIHQKPCKSRSLLWVMFYKTIGYFQRTLVTIMARLKHMLCAYNQSNTAHQPTQPTLINCISIFQYVFIHSNSYWYFNTVFLFAAYLRTRLGNLSRFFK